MPRGKYRTARNVGFSSERLAPCIYRILAARAYFHGSSPRMWGTRLSRRRRVSRCRFIPTHVGNTQRPSRSGPAASVHPHACGEHSKAPSGFSSRSGSSPRMWGTPGCGQRQFYRRRFIPTHVGNTTPTCSKTSPIAVHPHACGEHRQHAVEPVPNRGSSPRMWGTRQRIPGLDLLDRFIPTHVGNTPGWRVPRRWTSVHPHACGEHTSKATAELNKTGSSPRMWGTHLPYNIVFKEEKTPRKIYRLILYSVVRSRGWNATNCSPSNNTGCRRLTPRVWNS